MLSKSERFAMMVDDLGNLELPAGSFDDVARTSLMCIADWISTEERRREDGVGLTPDVVKRIQEAAADAIEVALRFKTN